MMRRLFSPWLVREFTPYLGWCGSRSSLIMLAVAMPPSSNYSRPPLESELRWLLGLGVVQHMPEPVLGWSERVSRIALGCLPLLVCWLSTRVLEALA